MQFGVNRQDSFTFVTDEHGAFTSISPAVYYVLGYRPVELLGKTFSEIAIPDSVSRSSAILYEMTLGRLPIEGAELGLAGKDGRAFETEVSGRPVIERGVFRGYQGVVLAISEYRPPAAVTDSAGHEAELLLDLVCHDVNNTNQSAVGYLEMAMGTLNPASPAYGYMDKCLEMVNRSSGLLRNVQKLQQISTGVRTVEKIDIGDILQDAVRQSVNGQGQSVKISYTQESEYHVMANALLRDAFLNIIDNAIKHSAGPPVIDVRVDKIAKGGKYLCQVTVDDHGPGISDEMKLRLFRRFERGRTSASGKGLGLYLVRKLIEGYGGCVRVEDRVQGNYRLGCRFVIVLPLAD